MYVQEMPALLLNVRTVSSAPSTMICGACCTLGRLASWPNVPLASPGGDGMDNAGAVVGLCTGAAHR